MHVYKMTKLKRVSARVSYNKQRYTWHAKLHVKKNNYNSCALNCGAQYNTNALHTKDKQLDLVHRSYKKGKCDRECDCDVCKLLNQGSPSTSKWIRVIFQSLWASILCVGFSVD